MDSRHIRTNDLPIDVLREQDAAHAALTDAVRRLADAQLLTEVSLSEVEAITSAIDALTERLLTAARENSFGLELDGEGRRRNHGNSVVGLRNPFASAVGDHRIQWTEDGAHARIVLGPLYEGPPGLVHGGVTALLLDQVLGEAAAASGHPGMTGTLTIRYRRPTPLGEVSMQARTERVDGVKTIVSGCLKDAKDRVTVEAAGIFIMPRWAREQGIGGPPEPYE